jgi:alpha-tubulin suppressor-like RCC1 family protein
MNSFFVINYFKIRLKKNISIVLSKMAENKNNFLKNFKVLSEIKEEFLNKIKLLYVLNYNNVLIVTNDDKVFAFGSNWRGVLGFGNDNKVNELTINEELSHKQIIDFKNSEYHVIARTIDGKVYCWGHNDDGVLGNGKNDYNLYKPQLNEYLSNKQIIDICCGYKHTLVLTNSGEVYAWGYNTGGQIGNGRSGLLEYQSIPKKVNDFNDEKVKQISCGYLHSMALTENGRVFIWGRNNWENIVCTDFMDFNGRKEGTLKSPTLIGTKGNRKTSVTFDKISCGDSHNLLLSSEGVIYSFGSNDCGQLGIGNVRRICKTYRILSHLEKFIDIKCHFQSNISIALSEKNIFYIWGECKKEKIYYPREVKFESFDEIFAEYLGITFKALEMNKLLKAELKIGKGRYREEFDELGIIAIGSYGIVCKATNKKNKEIFAIKKIPIEKRFKETALKEIDILPKLKSEKFIVRLESAWIEDNYIKVDDYKSAEISSLKPSPEIFKPDKSLLLHIQMELCSKTLKDLINQLNNELNQKAFEVMTPLGYYIASELMIEILESVDYLHKQNVIHRDLKPSNILITDGMNGRFVKIADFGLATIHEFEGQSHTKYSGTPKYRAPEVCSRNKYDLKADIYSLGFVIQDLFNFDVNE